MGAPRRSHKKYLSIFELQALIDSHRGESVYQPNKQGEDALAPWLLELLFRQAVQVAEELLGAPVDEQEFKARWNRTSKPRKRRATTPETPNTATFGGYRLKNVRVVGTAKGKQTKKK